MKPIVVELTGLAHSGKDTSADFIVSFLNSIGVSAIKIGLADRLKVICQHLIKLFYNIEIPMEEFYDMEKKEMIRDDYPQFAGRPFKLRTVLQLIGSEVFRDLLWSSIWCDYVYRNFLLNEKYQVIVLSDCRFPDEIEYFKSLEEKGDVTEVISARILRSSREELCGGNQNHQSEIYISSLTVEFEINNNNTKDDLYEILQKTIINKIKYLISLDMV